MSYICETITRLGACSQWVVYTQQTIIPTLTDEVRDQLILIQIGVYITVLVVKMIKNFFNIGAS